MRNWGITMKYKVKEVLEFVKENDVKFVRLAFCDIFGVQKNIAIMAYELEKAFYEGISFDGSSIIGFLDSAQSDLLLFPDPSTISILPWRPQQGRVVRFFCDIKTPNKENFISDSRNILKKTLNRSISMGYEPQIGTECEFYLFKTDENGNPSFITQDRGTYFDMAPVDKGENIRREICICLEDMEIMPETSHHEQGPGQNEIDFKYSDILTAADNFLTFKSVVKAIASRNGLFASFMPKPLKDKSGSGLHINISIFKNGKNILEGEEGNYSDEVKSFIAGILNRIKEITLFLNPISNSYERFGTFKAPKYISWSCENRSQLIRIPAATGDNVRMELRSADCALNPYIAFALVISAGLEGIEKALCINEPINENLYTSSKDLLEKIDTLPKDINEAIEFAKESEFVKNILGSEFLNKYITLKEDEVKKSIDIKFKDELNKRYFETI